MNTNMGGANRFASQRVQRLLALVLVFSACCVRTLAFGGALPRFTSRAAHLLLLNTPWLHARSPRVPAHTHHRCVR